MEDKNFEGFNLPMALMDCLPVIFFAIGGISINLRISSIVFGIGIVCCTLGGFGKVAWKLVLAFTKKDIQFLFKQMRVMMPLGFVLMILGLIIKRKEIQWATVIATATGFPCILFIILSILALAGMIYFAGHLNPNDAKSNWIEQGTNCIAQGAFLVAILLICA